MSVKRIFLIVTINDVGFIKTDPGVIPQGEKIPFDQYIFPSLLEGEVIEFISRSETGWLYVKRCKDDFDKCSNAQYGYVDWRYVTTYCIEFDLEEITVTGTATVKLNSSEIDIIVYEIEKLIYNKFQLKSILEILFEFPPSTPPLLPPVKVVTVIEIENILRILTTVANNNTTENFAEIMLRLHDKGKFYKIVGAISYSLSGKYPDVFFRICCLLYFTDLNQLIRDYVPDIVWEERKKIFRWPTLSDPNPIDKESLKKAFKNIVDITPEQVEYRTFLYLSIKQHQIDYLLKKGGIKSLNTMIADLDNFLDAGIQLLFKEEVTNPLLEIVWGYNVKDIWGLIKSEDVIIDFEINDKNVKTDEKLFIKDFYQDGKIEGSNFKSEMYDENNVISQPDNIEVLAAPKDPCFTENTQLAENETGSKEKIKNAVTAAAARVHDFLFSRSPYLLSKYPFLVADINTTIAQYKPYYYKKLSISTFDSKKLEKITAKEFKGKYTNIANQLTWSDLVYIWFYNLGNQSLGTQGNLLEFGESALTTKDIMNHGALKNLYQFTYDRASKANKHDSFSAIAHYDAGIFFQAVKANDIVLNFLGSFTIIVKEISVTKAKFEVLNDLSLESFSRFRKGNQGILESQERDANPKNVVKIGGTIRCKWTWEKSL